MAVGISLAVIALVSLGLLWRLFTNIKPSGDE